MKILTQKEERINFLITIFLLLLIMFVSYFSSAESDKGILKNTTEVKKRKLMKLITVVNDGIRVNHIYYRKVKKFINEIYDD